MSQTRVKLTPEQNITYWKERVFDKTVSMSNQLSVDMDIILDDLKHVNLDLTNVRGAFAGLGKALLVLGDAVKDAKTVEEAAKLREEEKKVKEEAEVKPIVAEVK